MNTISHAQSLAALLLACPVSAIAGDVWVVDETGTADFTDIQPAVNAAASGDTILVLPGNYQGFAIDGKSLSVAGDTSQFIFVHGTARVRNIGQNKSVTLSSIELRSGLRVNDCAGHVGIADSVLRPEGLSFVNDDGLLGSHQIVNSADVVISRSIVLGRDGVRDNYCSDVYDGYDGESALLLFNSSAALYSCQVQGGEGGRSHDGNCAFACTGAYQSDGGAGVRATGASLLYLDDTIPVGGLKGLHGSLCSTPDHHDGEPVDLQVPAELELAAEPVLKFAGGTVIREGLPLATTVNGPIGTLVWMIWSNGAKWRPFGGTVGLLHLNSNDLTLQQIGSIPASGSLVTSFMPPAVLGGMEARRVYIQVFGVDPGVGRILGTSTALDILDPAF